MLWSIALRSVMKDVCCQRSLGLELVACHRSLKICTNPTTKEMVDHVKWYVHSDGGMTKNSRTSKVSSKNTISFRGRKYPPANKRFLQQKDLNDCWENQHSQKNLENVLSLKLGGRRIQALFFPPSGCHWNCQEQASEILNRRCRGIARTVPKKFFKQFDGVTGQYPVKQGFWGESRQKVHPKVRQNLCRTSSLGYLFCPWRWGKTTRVNT